MKAKPPALASVAAAYLAALDLGSAKPTTTVALSYGVPRTTAANWVRQARQRGLIPPTTKGQAHRSIHAHQVFCPVCGRRTGWASGPLVVYCRQECYATGEAK